MLNTLLHDKHFLETNTSISSTLDETSRREIKDLNKKPFVEEVNDVMSAPNIEEIPLDTTKDHEEDLIVDNDQVSSNNNVKKNSECQTEDMLQSSDQRINDIFEKLKQIESKLEDTSFKEKQNVIEQTKKLNRIQKGIKRKYIIHARAF